MSSYPFFMIAGGECADDRQIQCEERGGRQSVRDNNASHLRLSGIEQGDLGECVLCGLLMADNEPLFCVGGQKRGKSFWGSKGQEKDDGQEIKNTSGYLITNCSGLLGENRIIL